MAVSRDRQIHLLKSSDEPYDHRTAEIMQERPGLTKTEAVSIRYEEWVREQSAK